MKSLPDHSVDLILCDPPYGCTNAEWDVILPFDEMWSAYRRILVPNGNVVLFSSQPFTTRLIHSNLKAYLYNWVWLKNNITGFQNAKSAPMKKTEDICVFSWHSLQKADNTGMHKELRQYLKDELKKSGKTRSQIDDLLGNSMSSHYFTDGAQFKIPSERDYQLLQSTGCFHRPYSEIKELWKNPKEGQNKILTKRMYFPQGVNKLKKPRIKRSYSTNRLFGKTLSKGSVQTLTGYPHNVLEFPKELTKFHPTQKPVDLLRYLIRTYTLPGMTVLDNCMGSGSTGVAARLENRNFIGMEKNHEYFVIAKSRTEKAIN